MMCSAGLVWGGIVKPSDEKCAPTSATGPRYATRPSAISSRRSNSRKMSEEGCRQNGYLSSRGGCQNRWHSLVNCDHGDSTTSRFDSPDGSSTPPSAHAHAAAAQSRPCGRLCLASQPPIRRPMCAPQLDLVSRPGV
eukprot:COSAG01_NODE_2487_length_7592_cov_4.423328_2_plen_137_part_00